MGWTIEHDDGDSGFGRGFEKISQRGFVSVEADASILNVHHDGIEGFERFKRRATRGVSGPIDAVNGDAGSGVLGVVDVRGVERSSDAVLGTEDRIERNAGNVGEN